MAELQLPPFVDVDALRDMLNEALADVVVCDCRSYLDEREGLDEYRAGHIPGARFIDLETAVSGPVESGTGKGRHPLPDPSDFADALGRAGISEDTTVVAYDDVGGAIAARFVWMLRTLGQPAAVLDGGIAAWDEPLESDDPTFDGVTTPARPFPPDALATADDVAAVIEARGLVVDSRGADRYEGRIEPIDPIAGHIPGAINLPFAENLEDGSLVSIQELTSRFREEEVDADTIFYCGSRVTACHNLLAAEAAGLGQAKLYVGSWSGWVDRDEPPVATGTDS